MLNETGFENQQVSTTNAVGGYLKKKGVGGSLPSPFFSYRDRPLLAGNNTSKPYLR